MAEKLEGLKAALGLRSEQARAPDLWSSAQGTAEGAARDARGAPGGQLSQAGILPVLMEAAAAQPEAQPIAFKAGEAFQAKPESGTPSAGSDGPVVMAPDLPADPGFANQYHLRNLAAGQRDLAVFRGDTSVWDDYTGAGVLVGVIDDGIDKTHVDLNDNYNAALETVNGSHPAAVDAHGTAVSGIIAAERNGVGVVGVAYDADITMMAAISDAPNITLEASLDNAKNFDVINNSWGFTQPWADEKFNPSFATYYTELDDVSLLGRGGLGSVFVKSAGNGRETFFPDDNIDNSNFSFTNAHFASVTVAAVLRSGFVSSYSTEGAANLVSAFGGPVPGDVMTTDRTGAAGYTSGDYTGQFNGTSSAAPMVSGVVALMLEANPDLGYRDVQQILAQTARHTGSAIGGPLAGAERYAWGFNAANVWNGGGMHFSEDYGFGLVDALAAVRLAESWTEQNTRANLATLTPSSTSFAGPIAITDNNSFDVTFTLAAGTTVEHVTLDLGLSHTFTADLVVTLFGPQGNGSELLKNNGGAVDVPNYGTHDVSLMSNYFRGEDSGGVWTLRIADVGPGDVGQLSAVNFTIFGSTDTNDVHVLTEEYSTFVTAPRQSIEDTNGGIDTLNASAVFTNSRIDLSGGTSIVDGVAFTIDASIENAAGGDGDDTLTGSAASNRLSGYRGADSLLGGGSADTIDGGADADTIDGGSGNDSLFGGPGADVLSQGFGSAEFMHGGSGVDTGDWSYSTGNSWDIDLVAGEARIGIDLFADLVSIENVVGGELNDSITGTAGANLLDGNLGGDILRGGAEADTLLGRIGDDLLQGGAGGDSLNGGDGNDSADYTGEAAVTVDLNNLGFQNTGGSGLDKLVGIENLFGTAGTDTLTGNGVANRLFGAAQADTLDGGGGNDTLDGGQGSDKIIGGANNDLVFGGFGVDSMVGGVGADTLNYALLAGEAFIDLGFAGLQNTHSGGNDIILGFENVLTGGGDDRILGAGDANDISTGEGVDTVKAGGGDDTIVGGGGADKLKGGGGADTILGGNGADQLRGGFGADRFDYDAPIQSGVGAPARDVIQDFSTAEGDKIDLFDVFGGTLAYIGAAAFGGVGTEEVRVTAIAEGQLVQVDTDGDGDADMDILVQNSGLVGGAGDFVL